jgi:hypothetical protein
MTPIGFVRFVGASDAQVGWGSNDDPRAILVVNEVYELDRIEVHSWHTKISLKGVVGKFNDASFEYIDPNDKSVAVRDWQIARSLD